MGEQRGCVGTEPRATDRELGLTVDPDRIPQGPRIFFLIGSCWAGCILVAVDDKRLPQAPQIRFTGADEQGKLVIQTTVGSPSGTTATNIPVSVTISSLSLINMSLELAKTSG